MNIYRNGGKRMFDVAAALVGLALLFAPMLLIAVIIRIADGHPVLFTQERVGRQGRRFRIKKFRTMYAVSDSRSSVTVSGDDRITRVGRVLRRWKLDELPQLLNVLVGEMSFVGPRPDVPGFADELTGDLRKVLDLRPGITGPASLVFRREEEMLRDVNDPEDYNRRVIFPTKVRINIKYAETMQFRTDIEYILSTLIPSRVKLTERISNE